MKQIFLFIIFSVITLTVNAQDDILLNGQQAPDFILKTDKGSIHLSELKGKVVLINFFATWCGPCRAELPEVQSKIWNKYKSNPKFELLIIGRQHTQQEVNSFKAENKYTMPFYADPDRNIYSLFAKQYIPRNYLIDATGKVVFTSQGYTPEDFQNLLKALESLLK